MCNAFAAFYSLTPLNVIASLSLIQRSLCTIGASNQYWAHLRFVDTTTPPYANMKQIRATLKLGSRLMLKPVNGKCQCSHGRKGCCSAAAKQERPTATSITVQQQGICAILLNGLIAKDEHWDFGTILALCKFLPNFKVFRSKALY